MKADNKKNSEKLARKVIAFLNSDEAATHETGVSLELRTQLEKFCESYGEALQHVDNLEQELHIRKTDAKLQKQNLKESYKAVYKLLKKNLSKKILKRLD
jgi:hypothetical protein